jgi:hypothetical protein
MGIRGQLTLLVPGIVALTLAMGTVLEVRPSGRVVVDFGDGKGRRITPGWLRKAR